MCDLGRITLQGYGRVIGDVDGDDDQYNSAGMTSELAESAR
jgi:hypothetical protein